MKIEEIKNVKITKDEATVNRYLAEGYKIIKILSGRTSTSFGDEIAPVFVLGITRVKEEKKNDKERR